MADYKKYIKNTIYALIVMAAAFAFSHISVCAEEGDWVEIVSVTPNSYDNYTDFVTFTATINYSLQSAEQGIVYLGFNTSRPNYYEIEEEPGAAGVVVSKGTGTVVLSKEVRPVNWDTAISRMQQYMDGINYPVTDFKIYANLSEYPHDIPWTPLAVYEAVLTDLPETEASANESAGNGNWSEAYEEFVLGRLFLNEGDRQRGYGDLYNGFAIVEFGLHDMDGDDIPELFIFNGFNGRDLQEDYIFSYDGTAIRYCGSIKPVFYWVSDYPGIFSTVYMSGYYLGDEYIDKYSGVTYLNHSTLEEYSVSANRVEIVGDSLDGYSKTVIFRTDDTKLYNASRQTHYNNVRFMTMAGIEEQGWEAFLKAYREGLEAGNTQPREDYKVYCGEGYPNGYEVFDCSLEACLSDEKPCTYNPQLAHMLIAMCNSVYDGTDMEKTFNSFGFQSPDDISISHDMWDGIFLGYGMAKKKLDDGKTLVIVVARGTTDNIEWASNMDIRLNVTTGQHMGFSDAADGLYTRMAELLGTTDFSNTKFVITGFSRGAAAANILAGRLVDEKVAQSQIYAYTFACPDVGIMSGNKASSYHCIFNIANVNDLVSWLPQAFLGSGWNKFGSSYWYSDNWDDYENLKIGTIFDNPAHNQVLYLEDLRSEKLTSEFRRREETQKALDAADRKRRMDFLKSILYVQRYRKTNVPYSGVWCPVDVEILTSDGRLAGRVAGDDAEIILEDKVYLSVDGGRKHIYFLDEDVYTLRLTATDDGTMRYIIQNIDVETQEMTEEKVFPAVALTAGRQMVSSVTVGEDGGADADGVRLFALDDDGISIAEIQEDGTEIPLPETRGDDGAENETGGGEIYTEKNTEGEASLEEKDVEDKQVSSTTGIPLIPASIAAAAVVVLMGAVILCGVAARRRKHTGTVRSDRTMQKPKFCPSCGKQAGSGASFCMYCGTKIA